MSTCNTDDGLVANPMFRRYAVRLDIFVYFSTRRRMEHCKTNEFMMAARWATAAPDRESSISMACPSP